MNCMLGASHPTTEVLNCYVWLPLANGLSAIDTELCCCFSQQFHYTLSHVLLSWIDDIYY